VKGQFAKVRQLFGQIKALVPVEKLYKYNDLWRFSMQQACFVAIFVVYLEDRKLISIPELEAFLEGLFSFSSLSSLLFGLLPTDSIAGLFVVRVDAENEFHLDIEDFLNGVCSLCSELVNLLDDGYLRHSSHCAPSSFSLLLLFSSSSSSSSLLLLCL